MTYKNAWQQDVANEYDETMHRKHGDNYGYIKYKYPDIYKLPETEIDTMLDIIKKAPDMDQVNLGLDNHIEKNKPRWEQNYVKLAENSTPGTAKDFSNINLNTASVKPSLQTSGLESKQNTLYKDPLSEDQLINEFYNHIMEDNIEGYTDYLYCDTVGKPTVGSGLMISGKKDLDRFTVTPYAVDINENNLPYTSQQKADLYDDMKNFCQSFYLGKDESGRERWQNISARVQPERFLKEYQYPMPRFQAEELKTEAYTRIKRDALSKIRQEMKNIGLNFDSIPAGAQMALLDIAYNVKPKKFKLGFGSVADGYWPALTQALIDEDYEEAAKHVHRYNVGSDRNDLTSDFMMKAAKSR